MLYLYILRQDQAPTQELVQRTLEHYQKSRGGDIKMLGGQQTSGSFPRSPDMFMVTTCLIVCKKNNIAFNSDSDQIAYSVDIVDGEEIGVCQIHVN